MSAALWTNCVSAKIIQGQVLSADGDQMSQIVLKVRGTSIQTTTDQQGKFQLDLAPGNYTLDVEGGSQAHFHQDIEVKAQGSEQVLISLQSEAEHKLVIRANPLEHTALDMATPTILMSGEELIMKRAGTLGEILQFEPGLSMSSFGAAVARPVIRGLGGARVQVTNNQMIVQDASSTSADHDVGFEPLLAEQIEVVKGPATLLYGSGAIGGIINATDRKINPDVITELTGGIELRLGDSATGEKSMVFSLDGGNDNWNWHVDGYNNQSDDFAIPGHAESERLRELEESEHEEHEGENEEEHHEEHDEESSGTVENTAVDTQGGSFGLTYVADWGYFGGAISQTDKVYGVPGHAHHEEEGEDEHLEEEHHDEEHDEGVQIDMNQTRYDLQGQVNNLNESFDSVFVGFSLTDYEHEELEGEEIGTRFENEAWEFKSYVKHNDWSGWQGVWGVQFTSRDFAALGDEAFVPPSKTQSQAVYFLEEKTSGDLKWELGLRWENIDIETDSKPDRSDSGLSLSSGIVYSLSSHNKLAFNYSRAARFASVEELYSQGPHLATQSYEIGNSRLGKETSNNIDFSYRFETEKLNGEVNLYLNQFDDFIYGELVEQGHSCVSNDAALEAEAEELQLICYQQQDAEYKGIEVQLDYRLDAWDGHEVTLGMFGDYTLAELDNGEYIPRIPPMKYGLELTHNVNAFSSQINWTRFGKQSKTGTNELATDSFEMLDLEFAYRVTFEADDLFIFFKAKNLLDEEARDHSSFLKDLAPRVGRNFLVGARYTF